MRKPQHAWIRDIDNSYNNFVPCFTKKVHFIDSADLPKEYKEIQARKEANPQDYRCLLTFGDHKKQGEVECLPNPYLTEIEAFDKTVNQETAMTIPAEPKKYEVIDETRLTYVDDLEKLKYLAEHLSK